MGTGQTYLFLRIPEVRLSETELRERLRDIVPQAWYAFFRHIRETQKHALLKPTLTAVPFLPADGTLARSHPRMPS